MTIHLYKHDDGKLVQIWYDPHVRAWFGQWCKALPTIEQYLAHHVRWLRRNYQPFHVKHFELLDDGHEAIVEHRRETVEYWFELDRKAHYVGKLKNKSISEVCS